jgi:hypothetical protein
MSNVKLEIKGAFRSARAIMVGKDMRVSITGQYAAFTVPTLAEYELVELR